MAITKRIRFEVFKRDKFTCQYCGRKAPDVVLEVDHIEPKSKGGSDDLLNLITSCRDCNAGKGDRRLSDDSAIAKQRAQLEELQERQEQLQMLIEWQRSLLDLDTQVVDKAAAFWSDLVGWYGVNESGKLELRKLIRKFGLEAVLEAMRIAVERYVQMDEEGEPTEESTELAFKKIGAICYVGRAEQRDPNSKHVFYIRGILRNRLTYVNWSQARELLEAAFSWGADVEELMRLAKTARNWTAWRESMWEYIDALRQDQEG